LHEAPAILKRRPKNPTRGGKRQERDRADSDQQDEVIEQAHDLSPNVYVG
jgi:hypothetical protein